MAISRRSFCVPSESLCLLHPDVMARNVPVYSAEWDSFDEDVDNSCERARKKSSTVNPSPPPSRKSCRRHNCRCISSPRQLERENFSRFFSSSLYASASPCPSRILRSVREGEHMLLRVCPGHINCSLRGSWDNSTRRLKGIGA